MAAAGALALFTVSANAATFTANFDDPVVLSSLTASDTSGNVDENAVGSQVGLQVSPWDEDGPLNPNDGPNGGEVYTSIRFGGQAGYNFSSAITSISFLWGSVDDYNNIAFFLDGIQVDQLSGLDVITQLGVNNHEATININIMANAFDRVVFSSTDNAFEIDNLQVSVVPLPAALPLYGAGVALLGFMGWRKRKNAA